MKKNQVLTILEQVGALIQNDHFVYTSGKHGSVYIRKDKLYPHTSRTAKVCKLFAEKAKKMDIDVVVGPSLCGIVLSQWTAFHLSKLTKKEVLSVFTEKVYDGNTKIEKPQVFKRGYDALIKGKRVLVVEDLTTTGASVKKVVDQVRLAGGTVAAVMVMVNRNPKEVNDKMMHAPFYALAIFKADAYDPNDCPLCKKNTPINTQVGHGKEYMALSHHGRKVRASFQ